MLIASAVLCQIALNLARPLISYKVLALGGDSVAVGLTSASFALLPVAIALWLGRMSDRRTSMKGISLAGTLLLAAGPFLLSAAPTLLLVGVASAVIGIGHLCFTIAGQSAIARFVPLSQHVKWPALAPAQFFVLITSIVGTFQVYDLVYVMTRGGPGISTNVLVLDIYNNAFQGMRLGYASAETVIMILLISVFIIVGRKLQGSDKSE